MHIIAKGRIQKLNTIICLTIFLVGLTSAAYASPESQALVAEGRVLLSNNGDPTYSGLIAANEKFMAAVAVDALDPEANFFYAVTRCLVFALEQENGPGFEVIDTLGDLAGAFGAIRNDIDFIDEDAPFTEPPEMYDDYDPPETIPGGETISAFLAGPFLNLLEAAITNLDAVNDPFDITLFAHETGDVDVEVDYGDVLVLRSALYTLKAYALIVTAYNCDIAGTDIRGLITLGNADLFQIQRDLLNKYQDLFKLRGDGSISLAEARQALSSGINYYRDACDYIISESDYQEDDLFYFDTNSAVHDAGHVLTILTELQNSLNENGPGTFITTEEQWILTDENGKRLFLTVEQDVNDNIVDAQVWGLDGCDFLFCSGSVEEFAVFGAQITIKLAAEGWCPVFSTLTGTLSGDQIINGTYHETNCSETRTSTFTGERVCEKIDTERIDFNYFFGNTGKAPLNIREILPQFDKYDEMMPGTFPPTDDTSPVLNGLAPDYTTNDDLTREFELEPSGNFNIPTAAININGDPGDWPDQARVFTDVSGDGDPDKTGTDIEKVYLAKDATYLYVAMTFYDGDPNTDSDTYFNFQLRSGHDHWTPDVEITANYSDADGWRLWANKGPWFGWEQIGFYPGNTAAGTKFLEWKVPLSDIETAIGSLNGKFVSVNIRTNPLNPACDDREYWEHNNTRIRLNSEASISGTISCLEYTTGHIGIKALDGPDPKYARVLGSAHISAPGPYTITGLPDGADVYIFARWDADDDGIKTFEDYWGMNGPVTLTSGNTIVDIDMVNLVDDSYIMTKPGKYRIFGSNTYTIPQHYFGPWDPNDIEWGSGWTFIGEGDENSPSTFSTTEYFKNILMIWHKDSNFYFDAFEDLTETPGTAFATNTDGSESEYSWITANLKNFDAFGWGEPYYFKGHPDGLYTRTEDWYGFSLFTMPDDAIPPETGRNLKVTLDVDADRDGLPDQVETNTGIFVDATDTGTDPNNPDSDGDGMPDGWEVIYGLDPVYDDAALDPDGDGVTNLEEYQADSNPGIYDSFTVTGSIMNVHMPDDSFSTFIEVQVGWDFPGTLPDDIESITIRGPSGNLSYILHDYATTQWRSFFIAMPGSPETGAYTFTVKGGHNWLTGETCLGKAIDFQGVNMTIPLPDACTLSPATGAMVTSRTPIFSWSPVDFPDTTMYYRLEINDDQGNRIYVTDREEGMLFCTVPTDILSPGKTYCWRVRVSDSNNSVEVQNRSHTDWLPFTTADTLNHSAIPAIDLDDWGAVTFSTTDGTNFYAQVRIKDHDGVSFDGTSHSVEVEFPDTTIHTLNFTQEGYSDSKSGVYKYYLNLGGSQPQPGVYTFTVTDPDGNTGSISDYLDVNPLSPPDENFITPSIKSESITATFDNVYVDTGSGLQLYDNFGAYSSIDDLDPEKWSSGCWGDGSQTLTITDGKISATLSDSVGMNGSHINFTDSGSIRSIQADITVVSAFSDKSPRARIFGFFYNNGTNDVFAILNVYKNSADYYVLEKISGHTESWNILDEGILRSDLVPGITITAAVSWDGADLTFDADDGYVHTFRPAGIVNPPVNNSKELRVQTHLYTSTTPAFTWEPVPGANHYRVRIYNADNSQTVWKGYTGETSYTLPPGILAPNSCYRYRIDARDEHLWFEIDNTSKTPASNDDNYRFFTGRDEAVDPFIDLKGSGVQTWNGDTVNTHLSFRIKVHDAQGVPGDIESVKVIFPGETGTEVPLYFDCAETSSSGIYCNKSFLPVESGIYTFTVQDRGGHTYSVDEDLTVNPIGYPSAASLTPDYYLVGGTAVHFDWEDVPGAAFYMLEIYGKDFNLIYKFAGAESHFELPAGFLQPETLYRYRITTRREFFDQNVDNGSTIPWIRYDMPTFITTAAPGYFLPAVDTENYGAAILHSIEPGSGESSYRLTFQVKVADQDGVPGNIASVRVAYPDTTTMLELKYHNEISSNEARYWGQEIFSGFDDIQAGTYIFTVTDFDGNSVQVTDDLLIDILQIPQNCMPAQNSTVSGTMPFIDWDDVSQAACYRVDIYDGWDEIVHISPFLSDSTYSVPAGVLEEHRIYNYRVNAFREHYPDADLDNLSLNQIFYSEMPHFTIGINDTAPIISAFVVRDTATGSTDFTTDRTVNIELTVFDDDGESTLRHLITETPDTPGVEQMFSGSASPAMTYEIQSAGEGDKILYAWAMDQAGNISVAALSSIYLDTVTAVTIDPVTTPTAINFQTIGGSREDGVLIAVTCSTAGVSAVSYPTGTTWSAGLSGFTLGDNVITLMATDAYENQDTKQAAIRYSVADMAVIKPGDYHMIADGQSFIQLMITLKDADGQPVSDGYQVQVFTSLGEILGSGSSVNSVIARTLKAPVSLGVADIIVKSVDSAQILGSGEVTFIAGPVTKLIFNIQEQSTVANEWSSYITVQARDVYDHPAPVYEDIQILLTSNSSSGCFETFPEYLTIYKGTSYRGFQYKDSELGSLFITADETPDSGWAPDTCHITITDSAPYSAHITASPDQILANGVDTSFLSIEVRDIGGNPVTDGTVVTVVSDMGTIIGSGGTVNGIIQRTIKSGIIPGTANIAVKDNTGFVLLGGITGDVALSFLVDNPLSSAKVDPQNGYGDTPFTFTLDYINPGNAPVNKLLVLDGIGKEMTLSTGSADHGTYECEVSGLEPGISHEYFFIFNDGTREYHLPSSGFFNGPIVNLRASAVIANLSKTGLLYGEYLTVSGFVTPAREAQIKVHFTAPDKTLYTESLSANVDGFYSVDFTPDQITNGELQWSARAISLPDSVYDFSQSPEQSFSVARSDTDIFIEATPRLLSVGARVAVEGRLISLTGGSLDNLPVDIVFIRPDSTETYERVYTDAEGNFSLSAFDQIFEDGDWAVQARFSGSTHFNAGYSEVLALKVSPVAGYAILVQGKLEDESLLAWHNKTTNNIYDCLKGLGFTDENIYYFNYDDTQDGVDELTSKGWYDPMAATGAGIEYAVKRWAKSKMNSVPAPLYIIFVDHGGDNSFYLGDKFITADELDAWIGCLEDNLLPGAREEKIVFIYGACFSGSFIEKLSRPDKNRIIITSADIEEVSYPDSPGKGESVANGEFFLNRFFTQASTGKTIKKSFELAANATQKRYEVPIYRNSFGWKHGDSGIQHPVLDDNGDGQGTHYLPTAPPGDGFVAHNMVIGIPPEDPDNVRLTQISPMVTMQQGALSGPLWARVSDTARCDSVWLSIKVPGHEFDLTPTQLFGEDPNWPKETCVFDAVADQYEYTDVGHFGEAGIYEVFFYAKDSDTGNISDFKRAYLINKETDNNPPGLFNLLSPEDNEQQASSLILIWEESVDPQEHEVFYIVQIAEDSAFSNPVYQSLEENTFLIVDKFSWLENLKTYYWRVIAVDVLGGMTPCEQDYWSFTTFNGNGIPGLLIGYIYDAANDVGIPDASVEVLNLGISCKGLENGYFIMSVPAGNYNVRILAQNFDEQILPVNIQSENRATMRVGLNATGDQIAPTVILDDPACDHTVGSVSYLISGTATDEGGSGLSRVEVSINNGQNWHSATGMNPWSYQATLELDANVIRARASDNATNQAEAGPVTLTFNETSKPTVTDIDLSPASPVGAGEVEFTITFSEAMDEDTQPIVRFGDARDIIGEYVDAVTWQGSYTIGTGYDGGQTISVCGARDYYGNLMDLNESHSFIVDTTDPSAPVISTTPQIVKSNAFIITLSGPSADANFSHYQLKGGLYESWADTTSTNDFFFGLLPASENTLMIRAVDKAGNYSLPSQVIITRQSRLEMGDMNGDLKVDLIDAVIVLKIMNQIDCPEITFGYAESGADVNGDGKVGLEEVIYIIQKVAELRN